MKRILVVEDNQDTQNLLCDLLELEGYDVRWCGEAHGVLGMMRRLRPDLVVLDVMLPGLNGLDLLDLIRRDRRARRTPVLVCSGAVDLLEANRDRIARHGAGVIVKPFALDTLLDAVRTAMSDSQPSPA